MAVRTAMARLQPRWPRGRRGREPGRRDDLGGARQRRWCVPSKADYPAGSAPTSAAIGDFNSDLKPDLVVGSSSGASVSVLLGNDDGTFQAQRTIPTGSGPWAVATGDLNADGKTDIFVASSSASSEPVRIQSES